MMPGALHAALFKLPKEDSEQLRVVVENDHVPSEKVAWAMTQLGFPISPATIRAYRRQLKLAQPTSEARMTGTDTVHVYSAVQYSETFPYHESLRRAFDAVVTRLELEGVSPIAGTIRVFSDRYMGDDIVEPFDRVVVDFELDAEAATVTAPALPRTWVSA